LKALEAYSNSKASSIEIPITIHTATNVLSGYLK